MSTTEQDPFDAALESFDQMLGIEPEGEPETPAVVEETPQAAEVPAEAEPEAEAPKERARDEQGRFTKEEPEPEPELILGKYKDYDALIEAHKSLEQKLGDPDRLDLQVRKLEGERDRLAEALEKFTAVIEQPEYEPESRFDSGHFESLIEEDPGKALAYAYQNDAPEHLQDRALDELAEVQPALAMRFAAAKAAAEADKRWEQRFEKFEKEIQPVTRQNALQQALDAAGIENTEAFLEAAKFAPGVAKGLYSTDAAERTKSAQILEHIARGMSGATAPATTPPVLQAQPETPVDPAAQAEAAKLAGSVASQTQSVDAEGDEYDPWKDEPDMAALDRLISSRFHD